MGSHGVRQRRRLPRKQKRRAVARARGTMSQRPAGALLFHPLTLVSVLVLVLNDHYLKAAFPSALTGKLSDFAGMFAAPLVLYSAIELALVRPMSRERGQRVL